MSLSSPKTSPTSSRPTSRIGRVDEPTSPPARSRQKQLLSSITRSRAATPELLPNTAAAIRQSRSEANMASVAGMEFVSSDIEARQSHGNTRNPTGDWRYDGPPSIARSILHKSTRLLNKRKSSYRLGSLDSSMSEVAVAESMSTPSPNVLHKRRSTYSRGGPIGPEHLKKGSISEPFNFQHLTHTSTTQAKVLKSATHRELVNEFSAIRASQAPKTQLKGIRAEDLPSGANSEVASLAAPSTAYTSPETTRPTTPHSLHGSKSVDSFTRLSSRSFSSVRPPISPPPRRSSRRPPPLAGMMAVAQHSIYEDSPTVPEFTTPVYRTSSNGLAESPDAMSTGVNMCRYEAEASPTEIAQAVTTPDDSACTLLMRPHATAIPGQCPLPSLEDVPEEEENAVRPQTGDFKAPALRHTKSFPSIKHFSRTFAECKWGSQGNLKGEWALSEANPSLEDQQPNDVPSEPARRRSSVMKSIHESWEDSIDYCYEHAMEADGADWEGLVMGTSQGQQDKTPQRRRSLSLSIPDLQQSLSSDSATSSSVSVPGIITPAEPVQVSHLPIGVQGEQDASVLYPLTPSLLIPREYSSRVTHEESYHQSLSEAEPKHGYTFYHPNLDSDIHHHNYSPRSSGCTPLSKSTSRDDLSVSRSASCSGGSMRHRNSSSISSVPELIRSRTSKEHLIPAVASDSVSSGAAAIASTIDSMRQDFIKQAEGIPEEEFGAISPTLSATPHHHHLGHFPQQHQQQYHHQHQQSLQHNKHQVHHASAGNRARSHSDSASRMLAGATGQQPQQQQQQKQQQQQQQVVQRANSPVVAKLASSSSSAASARLRSASVSTGPVTIKPKGHRTSYSLFPTQASMR